MVALGSRIGNSSSDGGGFVEAKVVPGDRMGNSSSSIGLGMGMGPDIRPRIDGRTTGLGRPRARGGLEEADLHGQLGRPGREGGGVQ